MTAISTSATMTAPFFLIDLAAVLSGDILSEIVAVNQFGNTKPLPPTAIIVTVGIALSPTSHRRQALSGIVYCNVGAAAAQFTILTVAGNTVLLIAVWNGRTMVNVNYGT